ncbi:MAG: YifB family Mg chelatase-like AAA ATPase [Thermoleophilia bacterium]
MLARFYSHAVIGMDACKVEVETDLGWGLPAFNIVGLPDAAVRESKERVRAGITNSEYEFPLRRITVNLAPADVRKEGPAFDLPIALSLLAASEQLSPDRLLEYSAAGELSLDGSIRRINGALSIAEGARQDGHRGLLVPAANAEEAALVGGIDIIAVATLREAVDFLGGVKELAPVRVDAAAMMSSGAAGQPDLADVKGQDYARRALEVCAAGGHNLLMVGPPGSGKTMLARRLPSIMPPLAVREAVELTRVYSVAGMLDNGRSLVAARPFRSPHHTISTAGLAGGGRSPRPGEVSLSHLGVLFLDELPEYSRGALETLRQPLEDGAVSISRALVSVTFPARFMLVAAMNPCPCGNLGNRAKPCICPPRKVADYRARISGPLLDRIDVAVEVPALTRKEMLGTGAREDSAAVAARVVAARRRQARRLEGSDAYCNAQMTPAQTEDGCPLDPEAASLLDEAIDRLGLSARAHHRIIRVARTIGDLEGAAAIAPPHLAEAIGYRSIDRRGWDGR